MNLKSYFNYTATQRSGLLMLFLLIAGMQIALFSIDAFPEENPKAKQQWLALQPEIDALKKQQAAFVPKVYPFNPNFITDYKGYKLGMSTDEIDRLLAYRKTNKYVNSSDEFQSVTKISDSLLAAMQPYFKFPDWVKNRKPIANYQTQKANNWKRKPESKKVIDINAATKDELMAVYGIGDALSDRILKQRDLLGGFVNMDQMDDIWGLSPEVVLKLKTQFKVSVAPDVKKIAINDASVKELSQFPYFRYQLSKQIVTWRSMNGKIRNVEDLSKIPNFPVEKVNIIAVYLEF